MADPTLLFVPLLVLPIVLLFRFVGCAKLANLGEGVDPPPPPPNYRDYILSDPAATAPGTVKHPEVRPNRNDVIGYWRLIERRTEPEVQHGSIATDARGSHPGKYFAAGCLPENATLTTPGSEPSSASIANSFPYRDDLVFVLSDPLYHCRIFSGGYVEVPASDDLYPEQFTIEAWVLAQWGPQFDTNYEHTLFSAGGLYQRPSDQGVPVPTDHGFSVVADRTGHWQVRFNGVGDLLPNPPVVTRPTPTPANPRPAIHLAVTVATEAGKTRVRMFVDGKQAGPPSDLVFYSPPLGAPLRIGVNNKKPSPLQSLEPNRPAMCAIQEVVLHRKALSQAEIENHVDINRAE